MVTSDEALLVEEERVVGLGAGYEPVHRLDHVLPGGDGTRVRVVVREHDNVVWPVMVSLCPWSA